MPIKSLSRRSTPPYRATPYDTGKVKIGLLHIPSQPRSPGRDALSLQSALLPPPLATWPSDRPTLATRLVSFFRSFV
jgi:hypothetical protein